MLCLVVRWWFLVSFMLEVFIVSIFSFCLVSYMLL